MANSNLPPSFPFVSLFRWGRRLLSRLDQAARFLFPNWYGRNRYLAPPSVRGKQAHRIRVELLEDRVTPAAGFWSDIEPATGGNPTSLIAADFNGDGKLDFVAASTKSVTLGLGAGAGQFQPARVISLGDTPKALVSGDFNGDSKIDIAIANDLSNSVSILFGNGDGTFRLSDPLAVGSNPYSLAAGDFNGDGFTDFATANFGNDSLSVVLGNGNGTFKAPASLAVGSFPFAVTVGDFNGDGKFDLASANNNGSSVSVLLGNGNGTFKAATTTNVGPAPQSIVWADFNKDGKTDLATANYTGSSVSVLLGNGNGTFKASTDFDVGQGPQVVTAADCNGDGKVDLITANAFDNSLSLLVGNGDGTFKPAVAIPVGMGPQGLVAADFSGDGKADLLAANTTDQTITSLVGNGNGTFKTVQTLQTGGNPYAVEVADFNNDGKDDLVSINALGTGLSLLLGNGNGTFASAIVTETGLNPQGLVVGDFNKDGKKDVALTNYGSNTVTVLLGNGNGTFKKGTDYAVETNPFGIAQGDLNGDGKIDLAVTNNADGTVSVLLGKGDGTFTVLSSLRAGANPQGIILGDYNRDGNLDLATANTGEGSLFVAMGNGDGTFQSGTSYMVGASPFDLAQGDFTGDGFLDLICSNAGDNTVALLPGLGDGTFGWNIPYSVGFSPLALRVGDFNQDGALDVATADSASNSTTILLGNGNGTFQAGVSYGIGASPSDLALGDFNGDGAIDLAGADNNGNQITILQGNGDGQFRGANALGTGMNPGYITQGDFNGDGRPDLVTVNTNGGSVAIALSNGNGTYLPYQEIPVGAFPQMAALGDFNGDGRLDMAVTNNAEDSATLLLGNGNGTFKDPVTLGTGSAPQAIGAIDLNGDKKLDLVITNIGDSTLTVMLGNGNGTFKAAKTFSASVVPQALTFGDFNGDGKTDIAVANSGGNNFSLFLGNGDGNFKSRTDIATGPTPYGIATGDFNGDGKQDIVTANAGGNGVSLLLGNGNGTFKAAKDVATGSTPFAVVSADFDGDGKLDLATANSGSNDLTILYGNGDGSFKTQVRLSTGGNPYSLVTGDFNGDGRLDLASANFMDNSISVLRSVEPAAPVITSAASATVSVGQPSTVTVTATGTPAPMFSIASGSLPQGLTLNPRTGQLQGSPVSGSTGVYNFTIAAKNGIGNPATQAFALTVIEPLAFTSPATTTVDYGKALSFQVKATGFPAPAFTISSGSLPSGLTFNGQTGLISGKTNAGNYSFQISASNGSGPAITQTFLLIVNKAALTITVDNKSKVYGAVTPAFTATYSGLVNSDTASSITGMVLSSTGTTNGNAGVYTITATGATNANYAITIVSGSLTISPAALTITPDAKAKVYGAAMPALSATYTGLVNGDNFLVVNGLTLTATATASSDVGLYKITASGATSPNYVITFGADATLQVTKAQLTITAQNKTKVYGASLPTLDATYSGLVNGDSASVLSGLTLATTAQASSKVGDYPITAAGAVAPNYNITYAGGTLSVTKASLTITADAKSSVYGQALPVLSATYSGLANGDTAAAISGVVLSTTATGTSAAGSYPIQISGGTSSNYTIQLTASTLTIAKAALTITPDAKTKVYGAALPTLTSTITGLVNGDTAAVIKSLTLTTTGLASSSVGTYAIRVASTPTADNYTITVGPDSTLTVTKAALTITADSKAITYGQTLPSLSASFQGLTNGDSSAVIAGLQLSTTAQANSRPGTYPIVATGGTADNYSITLVPGTLSITKGILVVTVQNSTKQYGEALPVFQTSITGFIDGDDASVVSGLTFSTSATAGSDAGVYTVTPANATASDYAFSYVSGSLTIDKADLVVSPVAKSKTYGAALPDLGVTAQGLVNGDTVAVIQGLQISTTATASSAVGQYAISLSQASAKNYRVTLGAPAALTVVPATLTITPVSRGKIYGDALPQLSASFDGLVNGDTASVVSGLALTTTATAASAVGTYAIEASGASAANYTIVYGRATLQVTPATLTITASNQVKTYGAALPGLSVTYAGFIPGEGPDQVSGLTITTTATAGSPVGQYAIRASQAISTNYQIQFVDGQLSVGKAALTITARNQTSIYGSALPIFTADFQGLVNGDGPEAIANLAIGTSASAASPVGQYTIQAGGAASANYDITYQNATLEIQPADLLINPLAKSKRYGDPLPALDASFTGLVNGDSAQSIAGLTLTTLATAQSGAGTYAITAAGGVNSNYRIQYGSPATLTVSKASLTIKANPASKNYGEAVPSLQATFVGLVNGDGPEVLAGFGLTTHVTAQSPVGTYAIGVTGGSSANYDIRTEDAILTVNKANLIIRPRDAEKIYGQANPAFSLDMTGLVPGDSADLITGLIVSTAAQTNSRAGDYAILVTGGSATNYQLTYQAGNLHIDKATLTVQPDDKIKPFGAALPPLTAVVSGFVLGEDASVVSGLVISTTAQANSAAGDYPIQGSGASADNYQFLYKTGTLTIEKSLAFTSADQASYVYGQGGTVAFGASAPATFSIPKEQLPKGVTLDADQGRLVIAPSAPAGQYAMTVTASSGTGGTFTTQTFVLTISKARLTISAVNADKKYGQANPPLGTSITGLVNGDSPSVVSGLAIGTTANETSPVGIYPIQLVGGAALNYDIVLVQAQLRVAKASLTIRANDLSRVYGSASGDFSAQYVGLVNSDQASVVQGLVLTSTGQIKSPVGTYDIKASGATSPNYEITFVSGKLTIEKAALIITAENKTMLSGSGLPQLSAKYSGLVNGDLPSVVTGLVLSTTATASSPVGLYTIRAAQAAAANYAIQYVDGSLTVVSAPAITSLSSATFGYGKAQSFAVTATGSPAPTYRISSGALPVGVTLQTETGQLNSTGAAPAGTYRFTIAASNGFGTEASQNFTLTITKAVLVITPASVTRSYGQLEGTFTALYSGLVNGDTGAVVGGLKFATTATRASNVGNYPITASGGAAANYTIQYTPAVLTIAKAVLTITPNNVAKVYGAAVPALSATYAGLVNGDAINVISGLKLTTTALAKSPAGTYTITASGAAAANYAIQYQAATLTINKATLTITPTNMTKVYGSPLPAFTASYKGLVNGDTVAAVSGLLLKSTATATSNAGTYSITVAAATAANYTIVLGTATLNVTKANLTIKPDNLIKAYGATVPRLTATFTGLVNGDTQAAVSGLALTTAVTTATGVGNYPITASKATSANYTISYAPGSLVVSRAALIVQAASVSRVYGGQNPSLSFTLTGLVNGDTSSVLKGLLLSTAAKATSVVGNYAIVPSGATAVNYTITYTNGNLTVQPATLTITPVNKTKVYGASLPAFAATYSGLVNGETAAAAVKGLNLQTSATASSGAGTYDITASGGSAANYVIRYATGSLTVTKAQLTVRPADTTRAYGADTPAFTATFTGLIKGDTAAAISGVIFSTTGGKTAGVGTYPIVASGAVADNYTFKYLPGILTVRKADLFVTAQNQYITAGSQLPILTVSYQGFVNGDAPSVVSGLKVTTTATANSPVGTYPIALSSGAAANYQLTYLFGSLAVGVAPSILSANAAALTYGQGGIVSVAAKGTPNLTYSLSRVIEGIRLDSITGELAISSQVPAGVYTLPIEVKNAFGSAQQQFTLTIAKAKLTIRVNDQQIVYGSPLPALTTAITGFVNGDTGSILAGMSLQTTALTGSDAGNYPIVVNGAAAANYEIEVIPGTLTISKAKLTITANDQEIVYGHALPALTAQISGLVNGDVSSDLPGFALQTTANAQSGVGSYGITVTTPLSRNYDIDVVGGTLRIKPAALKIVVDNLSKVYGANLPALSVHYDGLAAWDDASAIKGLNLSTTALKSSNVGIYPIGVSGATADNYTIEYVAGSLTVTKATLVITPDAKTRLAGAAIPSLTATIEGLVNGDDRSVITGLVLDTTAVFSSRVGTYPITASGAKAANYDITYGKSTLTIGSAPAISSVNKAESTYGQAVSFTLTTSGFPAPTYRVVQGALPAGLVLDAASGKLTAQANLAAGTYTVRIGAANGFGSEAVQDFTWTVKKADLTIRADGVSRAYGAANPTLTATFTGLVAGDAPASIQGLTLTTSANALSAVGVYAISITAAASSNYNIKLEGANLTVTKAILTVRPNSVSRAYGSDNPKLSASYFGLVNNETAGVVSGLSLTTSATKQSGVGDYQIVASGATAQNYEIRYETGTLRVTKAVLTLTADNLTRRVDEANPALTVTVAGLKNDDTMAVITGLKVTTTAMPGSSAGVYTIKIEEAIATNYSFIFVGGKLTVV